MNFFLDPTTRNQVKSAGSRFLTPPYPCSACFNGVMETRLIKPVHVNPPAAVKLTQDKTRLMQALNRNEIPVPDFFSADKYYNKKTGDFLAGVFLDDFSFDDFMAVVVNHGFQMEIDDLVSAVQAMTGMQNSLPSAVVQRRNKGEVTGTVTAIPNGGNKLFDGKNTITNGILRENLPSFLKDDYREEILDTVNRAIDLLDLDYATATVSINTDSHEVLVVDISTNFVPDDAIAIRYYMDELNKAQSNKKKK